MAETYDSDGPAGDGIEVTPEMIEAGMFELCGHSIYEFDDDALRRALAAAYRAMRNVENKSSRKCREI